VLQTRGFQAIVEDLSENLLPKVKYALCKCHAKYLISQSRHKKAVTEASPKDEHAQQLAFDNLFEKFFDSNQQSLKPYLNHKVSVGQVNAQGNAELNFLGEATADKEGFQVEKLGGAEGVDVAKLKINKQFKLINPLPKMQSVAATPQFFDLADFYIKYPDAEVEAQKYQIQGGMFSAIAGFFGRS